MKQLFVLLISLYQKTVSPDTGLLKKAGLLQKQVCVFYPTCSEYTKQAILKYGVLKGVKLGIQRLSRCHPWQTEHFDPLK